MVKIFLGKYWMCPQIYWDTENVKPVFILCVQELVDGLTEPDIRRWFEQSCLCDGGYHLTWAVFTIIEQVILVSCTL